MAKLKRIKYLKFVQNDDFGYLYDSSFDYPYYILSFLLKDEMGSRTDKFIDWLHDTQRSFFSGNITCIDKRKRTVRIYFDSVMDLTEDHIEDIKRETGVCSVEEELVLLHEDFLHIIKGWMMCRKYRFSEIWIKNDNGVFWVEGVT